MEKWLDIPGFEKLYQASNFGNIRTCEGKTTSNARYPKRVWKQRVLKQKYYTNRRGRKDARVSLWKDGKEYTFLVARLVALTWCDGYSEGMTVNHIDGNPMNNRSVNLEWVSLKENIQKGFSDGLYLKNQSAVILSSDEMNYRFCSMSEAGRFLGRTSGYISNCLQKNKAACDSSGNYYLIKREA